MEAEGRTQACPVCRSVVDRFLPFGDPVRERAQCPVCSSLERHRLDWLFLERHTNLLDGSRKKMLHVAPERCFVARLRELTYLDYVTADLFDPGATVWLDVTRNPFPDETFDVTYCSHVLEHVPDDAAALREFYRVSKSGGWSLLQVPIAGDKTFEDPSITSREERKKHFGQADHVRLCGLDYADRMEAAGFEVRTLLATDVVSPADCAYFGFKANQRIFWCRKPAARARAR